MRVVISAGGTGGHINPAFAIIDKIKEKEPNSEFLYIGTTNRMEKDIIPKKNIPYIGIEISGLKRKLTLKNISSITKFLKAIKICKKEIKKFNPDIVIGAGGYVTAPVIYAAKKCGYKTLVHEQNSILGLSNKILLKYTDTLCTSFEDMKIDGVNLVYTGNPCSESAINKKPFDKKDFGLSKNKKLVLIVMGSLGSSSVSKILEESIDKFSSDKYEVLIVTGKDYYENYSKLKKSNNVFIFPYIDDLVRLIKVSDLVVTRSGATTLCELIACNTPSILIPSPYVTENHQYKNALTLEKRNAAIIIEEKNLNSKVLIDSINSLISSPEKLRNMKNELAKIDVSNSTTLIYNEIEKLVKNKK